MLASLTPHIRTTIVRNRMKSSVSKSSSSPYGNINDTQICSPSLVDDSFELTPASEEFNAVTIVARDTFGNIITVPVQVRPILTL